MLRIVVAILCGLCLASASMAGPAHVHVDLGHHEESAGQFFDHAHVDHHHSLPARTHDGDRIGRPHFDHHGGGAVFLGQSVLRKFSSPIVFDTDLSSSFTVHRPPAVCAVLEQETDSNDSAGKAPPRLRAPPF